MRLKNNKCNSPHINPIKVYQTVFYCEIAIIVLFEAFLLTYC